MKAKLPQPHLVLLSFVSLEVSHLLHLFRIGAPFHLSDRSRIALRLRLWLRPNDAAPWSSGSATLLNSDDFTLFGHKKCLF
jgi:hypothetical protein